MAGQIGHYYRRMSVAVFSHWKERALEESKLASSTKLSFLFATHPNLAATYLFECGFWRRPFLPILGIMAVAGLAVLIVSSAMICSAQAIVASSTNDIGSLWGLVIIGLGLWRLKSAFALLD
ncbi:hypothetical protein I6F35_38510 [Bradyrhizobium sp. BRP22]|uniref:hypothetical protein n=1 Tax=Bradyrhizobium sp. BRP22 TaxID=2793821 RepID=UPI001CD715C4|nr:hypothetical protein [Bradyrhizobium sp. BRP22]MCA1458947.1 hypothetical protein [Bradyrhizobium sp. BRP22]